MGSAKDNIGAIARLVTCSAILADLYTTFSIYFTLKEGKICIPKGDHGTIKQLWLAFAIIGVPNTALQLWDMIIEVLEKDDSCVLIKGWRCPIQYEILWVNFTEKIPQSAILLYILTEHSIPLACPYLMSGEGVREVILNLGDSGARFCMLMERIYPFLLSLCTCCTFELRCPCERTEDQVEGVPGRPELSRPGEANSTELQPHESTSQTQDRDPEVANSTPPQPRLNPDQSESNPDAISSPGATSNGGRNAEDVVVIVQQNPDPEVRCQEACTACGCSCWKHKGCGVFTLVLVTLQLVALILMGLTYVILKDKLPPKKP